MKLKQLSLNFIKLLASRKGPSKIRLHPYNSHEWFRGAYTTVQRTKPGGTPPSIQASVALLVFSNLPKIRASTFDSQFTKLIQIVANHGGFSAGQAQKLCSMLLKYHLIYYHTALDASWNRKNTWVRNLLAKAFIPLDSMVLFYGPLFYPEYFHRWIKTDASYWNKWVIDARVSWPRGARKFFPWSKLPIDSIKPLQDIFRAIASTKGISPIELEMRELWRPPP